MSLRVARLTTSARQVTATVFLAFVAFGTACLVDSGQSLAQNAYLTDNMATTTSPSKVSVIDTSTNTVIATIVVGSNSGPYGVAVLPDGSKIYIAESFSNTVSVIDAATNAVTATITVGNGPVGVAVTPDGSRVYVANKNTDNTVSVIDTATSTVTATIPVGDGPTGVAVTPDGSTVYVTNERSGTVSVIATATNMVIATVVANVPFGVAASPDGSRIYVTDAGSNSVTVITTATNTVIGTIQVGPVPLALAVTPDSSRVYVSNEGFNTVSVIDTGINMVIATITVGNSPFGVAITPDGTRVYVANATSDSVSVIATATNTVIDTITDPNFNDLFAFGLFIGPATTRNICPQSQGFWKNQVALWPETSLAMGGRTYTEAQLVGFLNTSLQGNAALILADELIAARLNLAIGSNSAPINSALAAADSELAAIPALPAVVRPNTTAGRKRSGYPTLRSVTVG
jgi:YVTN family beta-propeller protein